LRWSLNIVVSTLFAVIPPQCVHDFRCNLVNYLRCFVFSLIWSEPSFWVIAYWHS
jgi:hypothetical protein